MTRWYRAYEGIVTDPKLGEVALVVGCSRSVAIAAWHCILESCAAANEGGNFDATFRRVAVILGEPLQVVEGVFKELENLGMIEGRLVVAWAKRQFESDSSTERSRKHRENRKQRDATLQERDATPPYTESDTETEIDNSTPSPTISEGGGVLGFEEFWDLFPKGEFVSKPKASAAYGDLTPAERLQAIAAIPALRSRKPTTNPLSPDRYLRDRLFASSSASRPASRRTIEVDRMSPQGEAWERWWRTTKGKGAPWSNGVWHFDTEWPPTEMVA